MKMPFGSNGGSMKKAGFFLATTFCMVMMSATSKAQVPILYYDFENNATRTTFENAVEQAINSGSGALTRTGGTINGVSGAGTFNGGPATGQALTSSGWSTVLVDPGIVATTYYQFVVNTSGFSGISISFDCQASGSGPGNVGILYSTDGIIFTAATSQTTSTSFVARTFNLAAVTAIDNQPSVTIRIYGYNASSGQGTFRIDNLRALANSTVAGAGTKTLLDESAIFTSTTSGSTGSIFIRTNFAITGAGTTVNTFASGASVFALAINGTLTVSTNATLILAGSLTAVSPGAVTVSSTGTLNCGNPANIIAGTGGFTLSSGGTLIITDANGITSTASSGNVQVTGARTFDSGANYVYSRNATGAQSTGDQLPATISGSLAINLGASANAPLTLTQNTTVSGTLALTSGNLSTEADTISVSNVSTGAITGGGGSSYVIGNLKRTIALGTYTFPVGTTNGYSPVTNDVTSVINTPDFTVSASNSFMTGVNDTSKAIRRTWTLSTTAASDQIASNLTFQFVTGAPPLGDVPATVDTGALDALRRNGDGSINQISAFSRTANSVTVIDISAFSDWTLANAGAAPTAVECIAFNAHADEKGRVFIQWQTGYEADNLGFNIYRDEGGKRTRVNPSLIAGSALLAGAGTVLTAGGSYAWFDPQARGGEFADYWLEDVDLNGKTTLHGPVSPTSAARLPDQAESILLSRLQSASPANAAQTQQQLSILQGGLNAQGKFSLNGLQQSGSSLQTQWDVAARASVKILIRREGWHRVTQPQLVAAGLNPTANPRTLQLFVDGQELPIIVAGEDKTRLDPSDYIEFFAAPLDTLSTDIHTYFLVAGSQPGRRIKLSQGGSGGPGNAQSFPFTIERKDRSIYFAALKNGDADNFFGPIVSSDPVTQSLAVRHLDSLATNSASLELALQGATDTPGSTPDHTIKVLLNGSDIGAISFDGQSRKTAALSIPNNLLRDGDNAVTLTALGGEMDLSLIDFIRLTYSHTYAADDNALRFTAQGREAVRVAGFTTSQIRVVDITDQNDVHELKAAVEPFASGYAVKVTPQDAGQRTLLAFADSQINQPFGVVANQPSSWNRAGQLADMIIISHRSFIDAARSLQSFRQSQSMKIALVDVEDIYDEFSYGARSSQAIKDFLARARSSWKSPPRFVLLAGDASFDPRNYLGFGDSDFVPTRFVETDLLETASDDWFVDFNSDSLPDMAIGRLPARTAGEATTMVRKIIGYEASPAPESLLLVADRNDGFDFEAADDQIRALLPANLRVEEIRRAETDDVTAKNLLIEKINEGQKIVNYAGHGSVEIWRGNLLTSADAAGLANSNQLSLFVMMTCLNAYFQDVATNSLAEALMKSENGGAVAVWASSSLTEPTAQSLMNQQLYRLLLGSGGRAMTIGEATAKAKTAVSDRDVRRSWILFGDPATRLK